MKKSIYILLFIGILYSCVKDDSSLIYPEGNPNFSKIEISSPTEDLSVEFGLPLEFTPEVTQTIEEKELNYKWVAWHIDDKGNQESPETVGNELTLNHIFLDKGVYILRLEVKNEDYSVFKQWDLRVRLYDQGYMVVGEDDSGRNNIAFARKLSETDILEGKELTFTTDLIQEINPNIEIKDVVHVGKSILDYGSSDAFLFIFTKDYIHVADYMSFEIINTVSIASASPGSSIVGVSMMDTYGSSATIHLSDGKILQFNKLELNLYESKFYAGKYDYMYPNLFTTSGVNQNLSQLFLTRQDSKLWEYISYHGAGGLVNNTTGETSPWADNTKPNEFEGKDIVSVGRMNGDVFEATNRNFFAVATDKANPLDVKIVEFTTDYSKGFVTNNVTNYTSSSPITLSADQLLVSNARYGDMYYFNDNMIYVWNPLNLAPNNQLPRNAAITLDEGKEVTTISISYDMRELYVGFYDKNSSEELKGGMYIYKCADIGIVSNLKPTSVFENITTKPKQILYKTEDWGRYNSGQ